MVDILFTIDLLVRSFLVLMLIGILTIFVYQIRTRQRYSPQLTISLFFAVVGMILHLLDLIARYFELSEDILIRLSVSIFISLILINYFAYLHYEAITTLKPPFWRHRLIFGLFVMALTAGIISLTDLVQASYRVAIVSHPTFILGIATFSFAGGVTIKTHRKMKERATALEAIAITIILLGYIVFFLNNIMLTIFYEGGSSIKTLINSISVPLANFLVLIGLTMLVTNYVLNVDYIFRLPVTIHEIMFYNKNGLLVYNRQVTTPTDTPIELRTHLISGVFSAISSLIEDMLGKGAEVDFIEAGDYQIFFSKEKEGLGTLAVISSGGTHFLLKSLKKFVKFIPMELYEKIDKDIIEPSQLKEEFDDILIRTFPYLILKE